MDFAEVIPPVEKEYAEVISPTRICDLEEKLPDDSS
jgi:hypothetical protein